MAPEIKKATLSSGLLVLSTEQESGHRQREMSGDTESELTT